MHTRLAGSIGCLVLSIWCSSVAPAADQPGPNVHFRGSLENCRIGFEQQKQGHVAFLGGSITEMNGYRPMVCEMLKRRFPQTRFVFTDAGISSTCSTTGAFRLQNDVLRHGPLDLLFVEFAVNDDQDAHHARRECLRGMEGILRHARQHNPGADLVVTYFVNPEMLAALQSGRTPVPIEAHEAAARHYRASTIDLAREVAQQISAGKLTWDKFGGTHPAPLGNAICAGMIDRLMDLAWAEPLAPGAKATPHPLPEPLDPLCYCQGRFVGPDEARVVRGWRLLVPDWKSLKGSSRARFEKLAMLCAEQAGAELTLGFSGTAIGAYLVAGPDAGVVESQVDGGPNRTVNLLHAYSKNLHYPRTVMFATDLSPGPHRLRLRLASPSAARIMQFVVNGP